MSSCVSVFDILHVQLHVIATFEKWGKEGSKEKYTGGNEKILLVEETRRREKKRGRKESIKVLLNFVCLTFDSRLLQNS